MTELDAKDESSAPQGAADARDDAALQAVERWIQEEGGADSRDNEAMRKSRATGMLLTAGNVHAALGEQAEADRLYAAAGLADPDERASVQEHGLDDGRYQKMPTGCIVAALVFAVFAAIGLIGTFVVVKDLIAGGGA